MSRVRDVDALVPGIRRLIEALMDHREGRIAAGEDVATALVDLRTALRAAFGMKVEERADG
jgi:hypothetical protein